MRNLDFGLCGLLQVTESFPILSGLLLRDSVAGASQICQMRIHRKGCRSGPLGWARELETEVTNRLHPGLFRTLWIFMGSGIDLSSSASRGLLWQRFIAEDQFSQTAEACGSCFALFSFDLELVPLEPQSSTDPCLLRMGGRDREPGRKLVVCSESCNLKSREKRVRRRQESGHDRASAGRMISARGFVPDHPDHHLPGQCPPF